MCGFILMELIRLGCIDADQINTIKAKFEMLVCMCMHTCMNVCMLACFMFVYVCIDVRTYACCRIRCARGNFLGKSYLN